MSLNVTVTHLAACHAPFSGDNLPIFPLFKPCFPTPRTAARLHRRCACVPGCVHLPWGSKRGQGSTSCQAEGRNTTSRSQSSFPSNKSRLGLRESTANGEAHPAPLQLPIGKDLGTAAWKNKSHQQMLGFKQYSPRLGSDRRIKDLLFHTQIIAVDDALHVPTSSPWLLTRAPPGDRKRKHYCFLPGRGIAQISILP